MALSGNTANLRPELLGPLQKLGEVCNITITSGFRDNATQTRLFNASDRSGKMVARPGHSNHEKGLAADISGNLPCAHANAARFGLVFPMGYEPWHIEPIGASALAGTAPGDAPAPGDDQAAGPGSDVGAQLGKAPAWLSGGGVLRLVEGAVGVVGLVVGVSLLGRHLGAGDLPAAAQGALGKMAVRR